LDPFLLEISGVHQNGSTPNPRYGDVVD